MSTTSKGGTGRMIEWARRIAGRSERTPGVLHALRGGTIGLDQSRRGTVLVIILGALALISVITVVYVTLGQSDRRSAQVVVRKDQVGEAVAGVRDYLADVIARDTFSVYVNGVDASGRALLARRVAVYPFTDPSRRSVLKQGNSADALATFRKFDPTGSYSDLLGSNDIDGRLPSAPFLASTTPSWLREGQNTIVTGPQYLYKRDWMQISCVSPDGRFVNLSNLAPVVNNVRVSGFDAKSGLPLQAGGSLKVDPGLFTGPVLDGSGGLDRDRHWMSWGLTLGDPLVKDPATQASRSQRAADPQKRYDPLLGVNGSDIADPNVPAHWSMYQLNAIRPMVDFDFGPSDPEYAGNQWADTDGDGFPDARWFEMVDASDPDHPVNLLPGDGKYRWFVAARIVDLSGLANVNIHSDFLTPPRPLKTATGAPITPTSVNAGATPVGFSPSDIDLRRLVTLSDSPSVNRSTPNNSAYADFFQPLTGQLSRNPSQDYSSLTLDRAAAVGGLGYAALRDVLVNRSLALTAPPADINYSVWTPFEADKRWYTYVNQLSRADGSFASDGTSAGSIVGAGQFGAADLLELLTYRTANDPEVTSRLEQVLDGRYNAISGGNAGTAIFGPMRSNRGLELETLVLPNVGTRSSITDRLVAPEAMARLSFDVRQYLTTVSGTRLRKAGPIDAGTEGSLSINETKLHPQDVVDAATRVPSTFKITATTPPDISFRDPSYLFQGFCDALAPYAYLPAAWNSGFDRSGTSTPVSAGQAPNGDALSTMHYGGNRGPIGRHSPELAIRLAAHMTANTVASYDPFDKGGFAVPPAYTVLLDSGILNLSNPDRLFTNSALDNVLPWWTFKTTITVGTTTTNIYPGRLDLGDARLANSKNAKPGLSQPDPKPAAAAGAINVFGITPQPFLVQASSFCIYKSHFEPDENDPQAPPYVAINGQMPSNGTTNDDYIGQILAFQLHNPFSVKVTLSTGTGGGGGGGGGNNGNGGGEGGAGGGAGVGLVGVNIAEWPDYYIEYNDHLFKLAEASAQGSLTSAELDPNETRVFYALSVDRAEFARRLGGGPQVLENILKEQFKVTQADGAIKDPIEIYRMKGAGSAGGPWNPISETAEVDFFAKPTNPPANDPNGIGKKGRVLLWRSLGSPGLDARSNTDLRPALKTNQRRNDQLADVLDEVASVDTLPTGPTLDRRLPDSNAKIGNLNQDTEPEGVALALYGSIKRHDDPNPPAHSIPGYLIEPKRNWSAGGAAIKNVTLDDKVKLPGRASSNSSNPTTTVSTLNMFGTGKQPGRKGIDKLRQALGASGTREIEVLGMDKPAEKKAVDVDLGKPTLLSTPNIDKRIIDQVRIELPSRVKSTGTTTTTNQGQDDPFRVSTRVSGASTKVNTIRAQDLLAALAIGPEYDPPTTPPTGPDAPTDPDRWITLTQAIALAMNYATPGDTPATSKPPLAAGDADFTVYARLGDYRVAPVKAGDPLQFPGLPSDVFMGALDRGHLLLDRFAPFEDRNANSAFDGVGNDRNQDVKRFPGIPLALNIFNVFDERAPRMVVNPQTLALSPNPAALTTMVSGLVNVNTAPIAVLRLVPLLSPTTEIASPPSTKWVWDNWLERIGVSSTQGVIGNGSATTFVDVKSDLAASVLAYRDALATHDRRGALGNPPNGTLIDFGQNNPRNAGTAYEPLDGPGPEMWDGRVTTTGIRAIRETPGMLTSGELLAIVGHGDQGYQPGFGKSFGARNPIGRSGQRVPLANQMDVLANDGLGTNNQYTRGRDKASGYPGTNTMLQPAANNGLLESSGVKDAWSEKLIAASGALGTTSTSSDVFAVWFVVRGYQRSDTEGLRPSDTLTPSIAKRYVMVVDRSNVTSKGQKPRIVLFNEVPLSGE